MTPPTARPKPTENDLLRLEFSRFYNSPTFSDLTLHYAHHSVPVHKIVLCSQSGWFARACEQASFAEASAGAITLSGDDDAALGALLRYCYGVWPDESIAPGEESEAEALVQRARVYAAADKYDVPALRARMAAEYGAGVKRGWKRLWARGELGAVLAAAFEAAAAPATHPLCAVAVDGLRRHLALFKSEDEARLRRLLEECPELAVEVLVGFADGVRAEEGGEVWGYEGGQREGSMMPVQNEGGVVVAGHTLVGFRAFCGIRA